MGELVGPAKRFLVPREFLRRRSRWFRDLLEQQAGELSSKVIRLPNTPVRTMKHFFVWTFSLQPQIYERATFSEVARLGIFAWRYQISALINQATDMIRSNLANGHWQLEASMVDDIYEAAPTRSPLREVIRAALGRLPRSSVEEEWKATFLKHAQLGWDYAVAGGSEWTPQEYLSGACRFHDHPGVSHQELFESETQCPYAQEECFPKLEEESMKSKERRGADEERKGEELGIDAVVDEAKEPVATEAMVATKPVVNGAVTEPVVDGVATDTVVNGVATKPGEPVVNGVAREAVVDDVATDAVVNGVAREEVEAVVDGVATDASVTTEPPEPAIDDVTTEPAEPAIDDMVTEESVTTEPAEPAIDDMVTDASVTTEAAEPAIDDVATEASVTTEAADPAIDDMTTEAVEPMADDGATKASVMAEAVEPVIDNAAAEAKVVTETMVAPNVVDGAEEPAVMEPTDGNPGDAKKKKKKKKKKVGGIGQS